MSQTTRIARAYVDAKLKVLSAGFGAEIVWQRSQSDEGFTESTLLREAAWVILSAGMSEAIVRAKFPAIASCFLNWESASQIFAREQSCIEAACHHFGHRAKIKAIAEVAKIIHGKGFATVSREINREPLLSLRQFPFIGPITTYHLAKNLGVSVAKPDRHLSRLATAWGYVDTHALCRDISEFTGDAVEIVDIVLWRFCTMAGSWQQLTSIDKTLDA